LGDSLQRIYGFIGAIPNLFNISIKHFALNKILLNKNYRFGDNKEMLLLDNNLRRNAENSRKPEINDVAKILYKLLDNQDDEAAFIVSKTKELIAGNPGSKVAILVKQRGPNINRIIEEFKKESVPFFYSLFTDEDPDYIKFNKICLEKFISLLLANNQVTKKMASLLVKNIKDEYKDQQTIFIDSLVGLLEVFLSKIFIDSSFLSNDEKIHVIEETFEYNGLKQYIEFVKSDIVISTVHGAKGLEWDFVILADMEKFSFPSYFGLCKVCSNGSNCLLSINRSMEDNFLEELSVFYVAVTRARKQVFFSASKNQINSRGEVVAVNESCFLRLPGISPSL